MNLVNNVKKGVQTIVSGTQIFFGKGMMTRSAALSYYSVFALPPMLVIIINVFNKINIGGRRTEYVFNEIAAFAGESTAQSLENMVSQIKFFSEGGWEVYLSGALLIITATTVFAVIQESFNHIFEVKAEPSTWQGILKYLVSRILSLSLILGLAFLMLMSLVFDILLNIVKEYMFSAEWTEWLVTILGNVIIPLLLLSVFFSLMFKILPDVNLTFKHVWPSGLFTAILFIAGKYGIGYYVTNASYDSLYSNAASLVIILVWSYYGTSLLFIGCATLKARIDRKGILTNTSDFAKSNRKLEPTQNN